MELWFERSVVSESWGMWELGCVRNREWKLWCLKAGVCETWGVWELGMWDPWCEKAVLCKSCGVWELWCVKAVPIKRSSDPPATIPSFYPSLYPFIHPFSPLSFSLSFYLPIYAYPSLFSFYLLFYLFVGCRLSSILKNFSLISDILYYRTDSKLVWHRIIRNRAHSKIEARRPGGQMYIL